MSEEIELRQKPTAARLISQGDPMMALHYLDRVEVGIDGLGRDEALSALRYWIGEAAHAAIVAENARRDETERGLHELSLKPGERVIGAQP